MRNHPFCFRPIKRGVGAPGPKSDGQRERENESGSWSASERESERATASERHREREREGPGDTFSCVTRSPVEPSRTNPTLPRDHRTLSDFGFGLGACAGERERSMDVGQVLFG